MHRICPKYAKDMHNIFQRYAQDVPKIYHRYAKDLQKICPYNQLSNTSLAAILDSFKSTTWAHTKNPKKRSHFSFSKTASKVSPLVWQSIIINANDAMFDMSKITLCGYTYRNNKTSATKCNLNANRAILDSSRGTTLGHAYIETAKPPQRSGQHIVLPLDCF